MYKGKQREDKILTDILEEDKQILKVKFDDSVIIDEESHSFEEAPHIATFWLENKPKEEFSVVILDDPPE